MSDFQLELEPMVRAAITCVETLGRQDLVRPEVLVPVRICDRMRDLGLAPHPIEGLTAHLGPMTPETWRRAAVLERALEACDPHVLSCLPFGSFVLRVARARDECVVSPSVPHLELRLELLIRTFFDEIGASVRGESTEISKARRAELERSLRPHTRKRAVRARVAPEPAQPAPEGFVEIVHYTRPLFVPELGPTRFFERAPREPRFFEALAKGGSKLFPEVIQARDGTWLEEAALGVSLPDVAKEGIGVEDAAFLIRKLHEALQWASDDCRVPLCLEPDFLFVNWAGHFGLSLGQAKERHRAPDGDEDPLGSVFSLGLLSYVVLTGESPFDSDQDRRSFRFARPGARQKSMEVFDELIASTLCPRERRADFDGFARLLDKLGPSGSARSLGRFVRGAFPSRYGVESASMTNIVRERMTGRPVTISEDMCWVPNEDYHGGFLIDRTLVSQKNYGELVRATERQPPMTWPSGGGPSRASEGLPVTWVSYGDADAFAEWFGKRLPDMAQLERGTEMGIQVQDGYFEWTRSWDEAKARKLARGAAGTEPRQDRAAELSFRCVIEL